MNTAVLIWLVLGIAIILLLILKFKFNAAIAMYIGAMFIGIACNVGPLATVTAVATGFGNTLKSIGLSVGFGIFLGQLVADSGGIQAIANKMVKVFGKDRAELGMAGTGFLVSIPVFYDVGYVVLAPLARALSSNGGKKTIPYFVGALAASLSFSHCFIPPTPGPLTAAELMGISAGSLLIWGIIIGVPTLILTMIILEKCFLDRPGYWNPSTDEDSSGQALEAESKARAEGLIKDETNLPSFAAAVTPIVIPIVLIMMSTIWGVFGEVPEIVSVLSSKEVAMLLGVFAAMLLCHGRMTRDEISHSFETALGSAGTVLLITGVGGGFASVLTAAGVGDVLTQVMQALHMPVLLFVFLLAMVIKTAQGSATVACVTSIGMAATMNIGDISPVFVCLAGLCGSCCFSHLNDSGFWITTKIAGLTVKGGLKVHTLSIALLGIIAFAFVCIWSIFF